MRGVLLCVKDFVRDPIFTQRNFFSETGATMLSEAPAVSDSITSSCVFAPWSEVESESLSQVIGGLKTCFEKALDRRRFVKDNSEQCKIWVLCSRLPLSVHHLRCPLSTVVEEGQFDYVPVVAPSRKVTGPSRHQVSPGEGRRNWPGAQLNSCVSLKFQVLLPVALNVLWSKIPLLNLPWHLSGPVEERGKVDEIGKLHLSFNGECHN